MHDRFILVRAIAISLSLCLSGSAHAQDSLEEDIYLTQVKPVLAERCYACHGSLKQEAGLRLDTAEFIKRGGQDGPAVQLGDRAASHLFQRITSTESDLRMPMEGEPLTSQQVEAIGRWIDSNAIAPANEQPESDPREHWAFQPVVKPSIPPTSSSWSRNAIDRFIEQGYQSHGLVPQVQADDLILVRRLYMDFVGMPPMPQELAEIDFDDPAWYESLVNRLLDDSRYGERWGRHWMDIWRYSDWWGLGDQLRNSQPHIWHWRDWIIQSLNMDLSYDEMLRQMLAADELYPTEIDKVRATGYLARNYFLFNRNPWMEETVEHVGKSLLGLTMNCAKCHDHKFDPIDQQDFYRMRAFFETYHVRIDVAPGEVDLSRDGVPRVFDSMLDSPTYLYRRGDENQPDKSASIQPGVPELLEFKPLAIETRNLPAVAWQPELQPWVVADLKLAAQAKIDVAESTLQSMRQRAIEQPEAHNSSASSLPNQADAENVSSAARSPQPEAEVELRVALAALEVARLELERIQSLGSLLPQVDSEGEIVDSHNDAAVELRKSAINTQRRLALAKAQHAVESIELKLLKAKADQRKSIEEELQKANTLLSQAKTLLEAEIKPDEQTEKLIGAKWTPTRFLNSTADDPVVKFVAQSSGRRTALADWITDARNPLTARVAVNHLWNRHFGTPLVATVFDFGRKGATPTNPELLDWLAAELVESGWSMKHIHRLIANSSIYKLSSSAAERQSNVAMDADNKYWWRRNSIRLESQVVRDSVLRLSGQLDLTLYGPPVPASSQSSSTRRSLYFFHSNNDRNQFLTMFDEASVKECYRRDQSVVPQQALALANSKLVWEAADLIAQQIDASASSKDEYLRLAFERILAFQPNAAELNAGNQAMESWTSMEGGSKPLARRMMVWSLLNHNDFVTLR